jgi:hypothetical protein
VGAVAIAASVVWMSPPRQGKAQVALQGRFSLKYTVDSGAGKAICFLPPNTVVDPLTGFH